MIYLDSPKLARLTSISFDISFSALASFCSDQLTPFRAMSRQLNQRRVACQPFRASTQSRCLLPNQPNFQRSAFQSLPRGEPSVLRLSPTVVNCNFRIVFASFLHSTWGQLPAFLRSSRAVVNCKSRSLLRFAACIRTRLAPSVFTLVAGRRQSQIPNRFSLRTLAADWRSVACERRNHRHFWPPRKSHSAIPRKFFKNRRKAWENRSNGAGRT